LLLLVGLPLLASIALAFTDYSGIGAPETNGLANFGRLVSDTGFWRSLGNSLIYVAIAVPLRVVVAVGFALLLHRRFAGVGAARSIAFLPSVIPDAAYALLWLWLLNPVFGPLTLLVHALGFENFDWLTSPWGARVGVAVMGAFQIGEAFVVALAARHTIPDRLYEAAAVDGASPWFTLRHVTLPMMTPVLGLLALRDILLSFQANFVPALLITDGGPRYATTYLPLYVYRSAFRYFRLGYASAMTLSLFLLTGAVLYVQYRLARRWRLL
jgi:multiple sugar transport system permease protein